MPSSPSPPPFPLLLPALPTFLGQWSHLAIGIGTPPQYLAMLPSTVGSELWAITPSGCNTTLTSLIPNCTTSRGNLFYSNDSSTLMTDSTESIPDTEFFFPQVGSYVVDTVTFNASNSTGTGMLLSFGKQTIAQFSGTEFWWGMLGLGEKAVALEDTEDHPSLLTSLKAQNAIPSLSYGFTAGAYYDSYPANLVLGGYDAQAMTANNVSFEVNDSSGDRALTLSVKGIEVANTLQGTVSVLGQSRNDISVAIDSMLPHLWLPEDICGSFAATLELDYDNRTGLYLVNNTATLRNLNPQFQFTLAANGTSEETVTISFDYDAFDHSQGQPVYNTSTPIFPIRRAVNDSQSVLGRAFLQEAYVVVDWERGNFSVNQATHKSSNATGSGSGIVAILPPGSTVASKSDGLSGGAIAGVVVGIVAAVILVAGCLFLWRRRQGGKLQPLLQTPAVDAKVAGEYEYPAQRPAEIMGSNVYEVDAGGGILEKPADGWEDEGRKREKEKGAELESPGVRHEMEA